MAAQTYSDLPPPYTVHEQTPLVSRQDQENHVQPRHPLRARVKTILFALLIASVIFSLVELFQSTHHFEFPVSTSRIAIIGAGPAGISTAFTLAQQFKGSKKHVIDITIFDKSLRIGGRMVPDLKAGFGVQTHAEDIASGCLGLNRILRRRAKDHLNMSFGMNGKNVVEGRKDDVGFWDGENLRSALVRPSGKTGLGLRLKLIFKYGASFWKARSLPKGTVKGWESLVGLNKGRVFEGIEEWISMAGSWIRVGVSLGAMERLKKNEIGGRYVEDVLRSEVRRQTGGELEEMSDLALSMALEREDRGLCVECEGGRLEGILGRFLSQSRADVRLGTEVAGLKREMIGENETAWILELASLGQEDMSYEYFNKVIIAAPWNISSLMDPEDAQPQEEIMYHPLWLTLISSTSKLTRTNLGASAGSLPPQISQIIPIQNIPSQRLNGIHEISYLRDIYHPPSLKQTFLYRILSSIPPSLGLWEGSVEEMYQEKIDNAYPVLCPRTDGFGKFQIKEELWWTGAMEAVGSEVDGAWVAGENVGELVKRDISS